MARSISIIPKKVNTKKQIALGIIIGIMTLVLGLPIGANQWSEVYKNTIGHKKRMLELVTSFKAGSNFAHFKSELGEPSITSSFKSGDSELREDVFVMPNFYIVTYTDTNGKVVFYAATTRLKSFAPSFVIPSMQKDVEDTKVTLGKTRFSSLPFSDKFISHVTYNKERGEYSTDWDGNYVYLCGAHDFFYYERYYFGNPGNYQTFYFGLNESGYGKMPECVDGADGQIKESRDFIINTYAESSPGEDKINFPHQENLGVSYNDVRILK